MIFQYQLGGGMAEGASYNSKDNIKLCMNELL